MTKAEALRWKLDEFALPPLAPREFRVTDSGGKEWELRLESGSWKAEPRSR